jgi:hypothetical protein
VDYQPPGDTTMTEEQARSDAEALALAMGITFYVVRNREGEFASVQMPPQDYEMVAEIAPPSSGHGAETPVIRQAAPCC